MISREPHDGELAKGILAKLWEGRDGGYVSIWRERILTVDIAIELTEEEVEFLKRLWIP